jgi:hypothetical protein
MNKTKGGIYLTYDNTANQDGVGAQLQRIVSVYSIARELGVNYLHTYIKEFDQQIFNQRDLKKQSEDLANWAKFFDPSLKDVTDIKFKLSMSLSSIRRGCALQFFNWLFKVIRIRVLIRLASPRVFTDRYPDCITFASEIFNIEFAFPSTPVRTRSDLEIAVHIRTGETALGQFQDRYLPLSYFESVLAAIIPRISELNIKHKVRIPTEKMQQSISINDPKVQESLRTYPNNPRIKVNDDFSISVLRETPSAEMHFLQNAEWLTAAEPFEDFVHLALADILILSKSSFSFLAGLANQRSLKIFHPFWHAVPSHWVDGSNLDPISLEKIQRFLSSQKLRNLKGEK